MTSKKKINADCKDVWNAFMVKGAKFPQNAIGIPFCPTTAKEIPCNLISYTEARAIYNRQMKRGNKNFFVNAFVHFYQHDHKFDGKRCGIWVAPERAAKIFRHFAGIITPDFSTNLDFPFPWKIFNTYRMRAFGCWYGTLGGGVINNVRWGEADSVILITVNFLRPALQNCLKSCARIQSSFTARTNILVLTAYVNKLKSCNSTANAPLPLRKKIMSKPDSGHFHGANGKSGGSSTLPLFDNGHVTYESIAEHREEFMGKSVEQIAKLLSQNGYEFNIRPSKNREKTGSTAQIIEITNPTKERNIKQVQVLPDGSSRHGNIPYVKISTSNESRIKVIDGTREQYRTDGTEKARLIFRRDS